MMPRVPRSTINVASGHVHWHSGGHIGHLMSGDVRRVLDDFLLDRPAGNPSGVATPKA